MPDRLASRHASRHATITTIFSRGIWGQKTAFDRKKISIKAIYHRAGERSDNSHVEESGKTENNNATLPRSREETGTTMRNHQSAGFWTAFEEKCDFSHKSPKPFLAFISTVEPIIFMDTTCTLWPILFYYSS